MVAHAVVAHRLLPALARPRLTSALIRPLLGYGGATTVIRLQGTVPKGSTVAATVERAGGVGAPTQAPVFSARA